MIYGCPTFVPLVLDTAMVVVVTKLLYIGVEGNENQNTREAIQSATRHSASSRSLNRREADRAPKLLGLCRGSRYLSFVSFRAFTSSIR